jgi:hypothetical protein
MQGGGFLQPAALLLLHNGKPTIAGTRITTFKMAETWRKDGGLDSRHKIERSLKTAALVARTTIDEKLPGHGKLREAALSMIDRTLAWFNTVHPHLDAELLQLAQLHISEDKCLILLSEEIIIMFSMIHDIRKQRMEFTLKRKRVEYMVRCIVNHSDGWLRQTRFEVQFGHLCRVYSFFDQADRPERGQWGWESDQCSHGGT